MYVRPSSIRKYTQVTTDLIIMKIVKDQITKIHC
jgi:hypothetical protein